ncbi:helix-turn-helix transcriptional regulator [Streptosporangium subroseum]|uniref:helix-turn-helix transcriptional regulator n=1 Tax=Streptosporangium subroseum TaxID=106412 RepID=UPI00308B0DC7|nr:helix-turn-helix transcriptional regulator [Streptosporangium subroseum]
MSQTNELGDYLRARRDLIRPEQVGLTSGGRRRVPGLRREEVALLAGISSEYYLRLEQGRDQHPSAQVLDALVRVLILDADATAYLHRLSRPERRRPTRRRPERVSAGMRQLVMSHTDMPALVMGRYMDVLVANPLAHALSPCHTQGVNALRAAFLDPEVRALYQSDWEHLSSGLVAGVRAMAGPESRDAHLAELVGELSVRSEEFRLLWARHDVKPRTSGVALMNHPQVGPLELSYEKLAVIGTDGQILVIFHAAPGSDAAQSLALLTHLAGAGPAAAETSESNTLRS